MAVPDFSFIVPQCQPGTALRLTAPDGVTLCLKIPESVLPGDEMHMTRSADGKWGIKHVVRGEEGGEEAEAGEQTHAQIPAPVPAVASAWRPGSGWRSEAQLSRELIGPDAVPVLLNTSKGPLVLRIVPSWAPHGAERFLRMVDDGFYSEIPVYRAVPNFLVQFGIVKDPSRTTRYPFLPDDSLCGVPVEEGSVLFAAAGANTRNYTICLFLNDFRDDLGKNSWETPIGKVDSSSLPTLHSMHTGYGDMPQCGGQGPDPAKLEDLGNEYIAANFPMCDFVTGAARLS